MQDRRKETGRGTDQNHQADVRATGDLDADGLVGDPGDTTPGKDAGGGGGTGLTASEIGAHGGGSPGAQAAAHKRESTGEGLANGESPAKGERRSR